MAAAPLALTLVPGDAAQSGGTFPPNRAVVVGTGPLCDVRSTHPSLSQRHAVLVCQSDGRWWVYDLRSRQGVRVNGRRTVGRRLREADQVQFGDLSWQVGLTPVEPRRKNRLRKAAFGDLVLTTKLHDGRSGKLYRAKWKNRFDVVLRIFPAAFGLDEGLVRRLKERIPQAARVRHENILRLYRAGRYADGKKHERWFLVAEHMAGGSLRDRLEGRGGPLPVSEVVRLALDIGSGLWAAAAAGLRHRNINPACILFDEEGRAKLGDFLYSQSESNDPSHDITRGERPADALLYRPPEQIRGQGDLPASSDLYGLAACMYEALTLRPPFESTHRTILVLAQAIREDCARLPADAQPGRAAAAGRSDHGRARQIPGRPSGRRGRVPPSAGEGGGAAWRGVVSPTRQQGLS